MFVNYDARWFRLYREALLENDPGRAQQNVDSAMAAITERLSEGAVADGEQEALFAAQRYLELLKTVELRLAA